MSDLEIWAATFTPFDTSGSLDLSVVPKQAEHLHASHVHGAFVGGTTGEFSALSVHEREELVAAWSTGRPDGLHLAVHVGHTDLRDARRLAAHAEAHGAEMIASVAPFYGQANLDATVGWLAEVAAAAPRTPFCFYHIPAMTGSTHRPSEVVSAAVRRIPSLRGVKFTDGDLLEFAKTREVSRDVRVYFGRDELLPAALSFQADAVIGSLYNGLAQVAHAVSDALRDGRHTDAYALHEPFRAIAYLADANGGAGFVKELMNHVCPDAGVSRAPLGPVDSEGRRILETLVPRLRSAVESRQDLGRYAGG